MVVQKEGFDQKVSELLQKTEKSYVEVAKLKEVLDQTTMEKNEASHKVETLEKDAQNVQEENDSLKAALQTKDNDCRLLQQTVQSQSEIEVEAKQKIESLESDIQSLQNETVNLKAALQSEKSTILELQSNLTEANTQVNDLKVCKFSIHTVRNLHFLSKNSRKLSIFFLGEKLVKMWWFWTF